MLDTVVSFDIVFVVLGVVNVPYNSQQGRTAFAYQHHTILGHATAAASASSALSSAQHYQLQQ
jgi:hypothetical protein